MKEDIFGNICEQYEKDHIWPKSQGGSNNKENLMYVCQESNREKADKLSGTINGIYFFVEEKGRCKHHGKIIGEMYITRM